MIQFDEQEVKIVRELIRNPRVSDNQISKNTGVPLMSVNRKRKSLEEKGMISYYADIKHGSGGTEDFLVKQLYIVKFKIGLTKKDFLDRIRQDRSLRKFYSEHIVESWIGEKEGHLAMTIMLNAKEQSELAESFNGKIVPVLKKTFGSDCIVSIDTTNISEPIREHHNYIHKVNMRNGTISKDWPDEYIFVDKKSFHKSFEQKKLTD